MAEGNAESGVVFDASFMRVALAQISGRAEKAFQLALAEQAAALQGVANAGAPHGEGKLVATSFTDSGSTHAGNPAATVGYDSPIAGAVHEGFHGGKQIKTDRRFWLQSAANGFADRFAARMIEVARGAVGG